MGHAQYRRDAGRHDRAVLAAIRMELAANLPVVEKNQKDIAEELERLTKDEWLLNPLEPLEAGFWNLAKLNPPKSISANAGLLGNFQRVARLTFKVNEVIRSREAFRVGNQGIADLQDQAWRAHHEPSPPTTDDEPASSL